MADKRVERLSLSDIPDDFGMHCLPKDISLKKKKKAYGFLSGCYVNKVEVFAGNGKSVFIRGEVHPSQRKNDPCHIVNMEVDLESTELLDSHCRCQQGADGSCSHVVTIIMMIEQMKMQGYKDFPSLLTSTSLPQQWDKPRGDKILPEPVSQMVFASPTNLSRKRRPIMAQFIDKRNVSVVEDDIEDIKKMKSSAISYLVEEVNDTTPLIDTPFGQVPVGSALSYHGPLAESVTTPQDQCTDCGDFRYPQEIDRDIIAAIEGQEQHWSNMTLSADDVKNIEINTRSQNSSARWHQERAKRITASTFGAIMTRQKEVNEAFMKNTFNQKSFLSKPTSYGNANEKNAKKLYAKRVNGHLHDIGLVINPLFPFLGGNS